LINTKQEHKQEHVQEFKPSGQDIFVPEERSSAFNIFLVILINSGNYFFGYYIAITNVVADPLLKGVYK
jgi:MFS family permease